MWLPRTAAAVPASMRERRRVPRSLPVPVVAGEPDDGYPSPWLMCRWVAGVPTRQSGERVWAAAIAAAPWPGPGVWVHRNLCYGNLLIVHGRLSGVIELGGGAVGDPAGDVPGAFHMLSPADRREFGAIVGVDEATGHVLGGGRWFRASPYYLDSHPGMVAMARRVMAAALDAHLPHGRARHHGGSGRWRPR